MKQAHREKKGNERNLFFRCALIVKVASPGTGVNNSDTAIYVYWNIKLNEWMVGARLLTVE